MQPRKKLFHLFSLLVMASLVLVACAPAATQAPATTEPPTDGSGAPADLVAAAKAEGTLTTIALPHDWCNYGEVIETFKSKYGLEVNELNPDAGSGDEIEAIKANKAAWPTITD